MSEKDANELIKKIWLTVIGGVILMVIAGAVALFRQSATTPYELNSINQKIEELKASDREQATKEYVALKTQILLEDMNRVKEKNLEQDITMTELKRDINDIAKFVRKQ